MIHRSSDITQSVTVKVKATDVDRIKDKIKDYATVASYVRGLIVKDLDKTNDNIELKLLKKRFDRLTIAHNALKYNRR